MATLEIHDGRNQVRRVRISREVPAMFGADPMCDIVLEGAGVKPFHGRIRWKTSRFKADAAPEVPWIEINGVQVKSKSLYQGDEIRVGACRIFLISLEEGPDHGEKTVVQDRPVSSGQGKPPAPEFHRMEMAPPSMEGPPPEFLRETPLKRSKYRRPKDFDDVDDALGNDDTRSFLKAAMSKAGESSASGAAVQVPDKSKRSKGRAGGWMGSLERAPGDDRVLTSPMVIGLIVTFALLVGFSFGLWGMIGRANAYRQYNLAVEDMESGNFPAAIKEFDRFVESFPTDRRADKARVLRALGRVRQHTGTVGPSWGNALNQAKAMVEEVGQVEEYRDSSLDLAEEIRKAAEALADRAADLAEPKVLGEAEAAIALHARVAGQAAGSLLDRSKIPAKLAKARAAIRKSKDRAEALALMDAALKATRPGDAYASRDALVRRYADLAADPEVVRRVALANEQVRATVVLEPPSGSTAQTAPRPERLGPPTSLVLRLDPARPATANGAVALAEVDGMAYGLDAATGAPLWQVPVGLACPFPPVAIAGDPASWLAVDARSDELMRRSSRTGDLIWRQSLGVTVADPPLILGNQLFQPTTDGRLIQLDLATGAIRGTLVLGRDAPRTPVADEAAAHLYLLADSDCLFVLAFDPLRCVAVEYLGHDAGSVAAAPARAGRFYVVPENHAIDSGRWRVFVIDEAGTKLKPVQELPVGGWTTSTPASAGPVIWSSSDRGELVAYSIGGYDTKAPFTPIARVAPGTELEGPAFPRARTEREFWLASSRSGRLELDLERGKLTPTWTLREAGPALAPPQAFDRILVLTQQADSGPGAALWGVDANSGEVRWRTHLGTRWTIPPTASPTGDRLSTLGVDGREVAIGLDRLRSGGFVELPLPRAGYFRLPVSTSQRLDLGGGTTIIVPEPNGSKILVRVGTGEFRPVELPAPLASPVLALGPDLVIPGLDGRIYLVDPKTGASSADPYVPPFDRSRPIRWRRPVPVDGDAFVLADSEATLRRLAVDRTVRPRLATTAELKLDSPLAADPASTGASVLVVTQDGKVRSLASRDLGPQGSWPLEAPRLLGPVVVVEHAFVADSAGNVLAFALDGRRIWSIQLRDTIAAGPPAVLDRSAWFLGRDGSVQRYSLIDGAPQSATPLEVLPSGGPIAIGSALALPTGPGSLRLLDPGGLKP